MGHTELEGAGLAVAFAGSELTVEIGRAGLPGLTGEGLEVRPALTELAKHKGAELTVALASAEIAVEPSIAKLAVLAGLTGTELAFKFANAELAERPGARAQASRQCPARRSGRA